MKKSHKWIDYVKARCPYCGELHFYDQVGDKGDLIYCSNCDKQFQLGEQK